VNGFFRALEDYDLELRQVVKYVLAALIFPLPSLTNRLPYIAWGSVDSPTCTHCMVAFYPGKFSPRLWSKLVQVDWQFHCFPLLDIRED